MHSIGFKVFLYYWLSVIAVIIVANVLGPDTLRRPQLIKEAVVTSMTANGQMMAETFEQHGCENLNSPVTAAQTSVVLATPDGKPLCGSASDVDLQRYAKAVGTGGSIFSHRFKRYQLLLIPLTSSSGRHYLVAMRSYYASPLQAFGWMPGATTWIASFIASVLLAAVLSRPLRRLRLAARQLAGGDLSSRVQWPGLSREDSLSRRDEVRGLMNDFNHMATCLQALVESQRTLLRDVSHELRSPLARLNVALQLAREDLLSGNTPRHLDRIEKEAELLNHLITQLLSLSSLQHGQALQGRHPVLLHEVVQQLTQDAQFEASTRNCKVTLEAVSDTCCVEGSEQLLRGAVENVVRNAIHYSGYGGAVEIKLSSVVKGDGNYAVISVSDSGPGLPPEELRKIFSPFYRVDDSRRRITGGFGIGLSIVERSIQLHLGEVFAENRNGGGLTVTMSLPLATQARAVLSGVALIPRHCHPERSEESAFVRSATAPSGKQK